MSKPSGSDAEDDVPVLGNITNWPRPRPRPEVVARGEAIVSATREQEELEDRRYSFSVELIPPNRRVCPNLEEVPEEHPAWSDWIASYHDFFDLTNLLAHQSPIHACPYIAPFQGEIVFPSRHKPLVFFAVFLGADDLARDYDHWLRPRVQDYITAKFRTKLELRFYQMTFGPQVDYRSDSMFRPQEVRPVPKMGDSIGSDVKGAVGSICAFVRIKRNGVLQDDQYALTCYHVLAGMDRTSPFLADTGANYSIDATIQSPAKKDLHQHTVHLQSEEKILSDQIQGIDELRQKYADPQEREILEYLAGDDFKQTQRLPYETIIQKIDDDGRLNSLKRDLDGIQAKLRSLNDSNISLGVPHWSSGIVSVDPLRRDSYSEKCLMDYALIKIRPDRHGINRLGASASMGGDCEPLSFAYVGSNGKVGPGLLRPPKEWKGEKDAAPWNEEDSAPISQVIKCGRTTGITYGSTRMRRMLYKRANGKLFADYAIWSRDKTAFSAKGDSGAPIIRQHGGLIGMLTGGAYDLNPERDVSVYLPFQMIQEDFLKRVGHELVWDYRQTGEEGGFEESLPAREEVDE